MKKSVAIASAVACLMIGTVALRAASQSVTVEDAVSTERILDLMAPGQEKVAIPEGRPVILAETQFRPVRHDHDGDWGGGGGGGVNYVRCESIDYARRECYVGNRGVYSIDVYQQHSRAACTRANTWGYDGNSIWVSNGCRATFAVRSFN